MAKVRVNVLQKCLFTHPDGRLEEFQPGRQSVDKEVAEHWFFAAHTSKPPASFLNPANPEHAAILAAREAEPVDDEDLSEPAPAEPVNPEAPVNPEGAGITAGGEEAPTGDAPEGQESGTAPDGGPIPRRRPAPASASE